MLNSFEYSLPKDLDRAVHSELRTWQDENKIGRIWSKDATVWTDSDESGWLGWLDIVERELGDLDKYSRFSDDIAAAGFSHILLMGMGGSSLCPEVLATTFGKAQFRILDSTVPAQVRSVEDAIDLTRTLFIVASKSGTTLEPNCFKQYFFERAAERVGREVAGDHFVAITDPDSVLERVAREDGFRQVFFGETEIGGRFSALSVFGMAPAAAMGLDVEWLLRSAGEMVEACRLPDTTDNPGTVLGTILGAAQRKGRDKLTIFTSPELAALGTWLEQLLAESTGKNGVAIIPVDREPLLDIDAYGDDRLSAYIKVRGSNALDAAIHDLEIAGHPLVRIEMDDRYGIGQEFFRWEFATAVAGSMMGIDPFDQPDVESAKTEAKKITAEYEATGELPKESPFYREDGLELFSSSEYARELRNSVDGKSLANFLEAHLLNISDGDYFALLAYVEMNDENEALLQAIRESVLEQHAVATCLGFGPRFLHSTGQAYKGGPDSGVFLQITADDEFDLPVPGQKYTFGVVKAAQARGDFQVLIDRERRALRVHLGTDVRAGLIKIESLIRAHS